MSFGSRLKERRETLRMTQAQVGSALGVTGAAIGNYEKGISFPNADILYRVFSTMKCDANFLFQDEMSDYYAGKQPGLVALEDCYLQLNEEGQTKLIEYADDLVSSGKYIKTCQDGLGGAKEK